MHNETCPECDGTFRVLERPCSGQPWFDRWVPCQKCALPVVKDDMPSEILNAVVRAAPLCALCSRAIAAYVYMQMTFSGDYVETHSCLGCHPMSDSLLEKDLPKARWAVVFDAIKNGLERGDWRQCSERSDDGICCGLNEFHTGPHYWSGGMK